MSGPRGYNDWVEWLRVVTKSFSQHKCEVCGLWVVWKPKVAHEVV